MRVTKDPIDRINEKWIEESGPISNSLCHIWTGSCVSNHPRIGIDRNRSVLVKRFLWMEFNGEIPEGYRLYSICKNSKCVNLSHMQLLYSGTWTVMNVIPKAQIPPNYNGNKTYCPHGHPYDEENTRIYNGIRYCKTCKRERSRQYRLQKKQNSAWSDFQARVAETIRLQSIARQPGASQLEGV